MAADPSPSNQEFDLVVLGAGTGGYTAAFRAAQLGLRVALVDEDKIGGTCLHRGCIPTKALLESAGFAERVRHAADFGVVVSGDPGIDYPQMAKRRDDVVGRMWKGLQSLVKKNQVTWVAGRGRLDGPNRVRVAAPDGPEVILQAKDVIIATGSRVKSLPGLTVDGTSIVTSDEVLRLDRVPKDVIIVGAGAVGVEFASMYSDLGATVTLLEYLPSIVPAEDAEVSRELERAFARRGVTVITNARFDAASVTVNPDGVCLKAGPEGKEPQELKAEMLLVAAGRAPNTENIGLETTKVQVERGFIKVDGRTRTAEPHVYAIGDVIGGVMLAHTAAHEGLIAVHTIAGDPDVHEMDYVKQPKATYSRPEIASIGLTESQARERGYDVRVGKVPFQAIAKALIGGEYVGFTKVVADAKSGDTLGVHMIGPHVTDLIAEASLALELDATPQEIGGTTHPHPTVAEILGEASLAVNGRSINF